MPVAHRFDQKFDSEAVSGTSSLRLVAFQLGNHIKSSGHRETLDNDPCAALMATPPPFPATQSSIVESVKETVAYERR